MRAFQHESKLKKVALSVAIFHCDEIQINALRDVFDTLDRNGDGILTTAELRDGLTGAGVGGNSTELEEIMAAVDADGSGEIDYTEFLAATIESRQCLRESACRAAFRVFDKDDDGRITLEELASVLRDRQVMKTVGPEQIAQIMQEVDLNGDGYIDFKEFSSMLQN